MPRDKKYLRVGPGQRIDYPDFQFQARTSQFKSVTQVGDGALIGEDRDRSTDGTAAQARGYVLSGFDVSKVGAVVTINGGTAILGYQLDGATEYGAILTTRPGYAITIDVSGATSPAVLHGVYIKFTALEEEIGNRVFWNSAAATPTEVVRTTPTRFIDDFEVAIEITSPGEPWIQIATITPDAGNVDVGDKRNFYFEGRADAATPFQIDDTDWGIANDRDAARATYGVFGFARWIRGINRQVQDMLGVVNGLWSTALPTFDSGSTVASLTNLASDKLSREGSASAQGTMLGHLHPDAAQTNNLDLGEATQSWRRLYANFATLGKDYLADNVESLSARLNIPVFNDPIANTRTLVMYSENASVASATMRKYRHKDGSYETTWNASWSNATGLWTHDDTAVDAYAKRYDIDGALGGQEGVYLLKRSAAASTWSDVTTGAPDWELRQFIDVNSGLLDLYSGTSAMRLESAYPASSTSISPTRIMPAKVPIAWARVTFSHVGVNLATGYTVTVHDGVNIISTGVATRSYDTVTVRCPVLTFNNPALTTASVVATVEVVSGASIGGSMDPTALTERGIMNIRTYVQPTYAHFVPTGIGNPASLVAAGPLQPYNGSGTYTFSFTVWAS